MKIIHTSDWHLGKKLYGKSRYEETEKFLDWLIETTESESADALIISGDVFDTISPSNRALEQYYGFLYKISTSCCENVIIIAGNHDSPSLLNAPRELLKVFNVHVIASASENFADEVLIIQKKDKTPGAVVCAVPYLREKDLRIVFEDESPDDKSAQMLKGIKEHYSKVIAAALEICKSHSGRLSLIVTGHLFAAGGMTLSGDGVREIYVGSLERVGCDIFPDEIDYLALGHLHIPQKVFGCDCRRYSGSPIPVGFSEANQKKMVLSVDFSGEKPSVKEIYVPQFQKLITITGDIEKIRDEIFSLRISGAKTLAEVIYTGDALQGDLRGLILEMTKDSCVEVLRIKNESLAAGILESRFEGESLESLSEYDVFKRCLQSAGVPNEQKEELFQTFKETLSLLHEEDLYSE